jgi:hypothetical protein
LARSRTNDRVVIGKQSQSSVLVGGFFFLEEAIMNELYTWFSHQHHGLRTFRTFQQKLENLSTEEPGHRGLYRLLSNLVGRYVDAFDEEPLPISVADRAYDRLLELLGSLDLRANADRRLADIDRVAASDLFH